LVQKKYGLKEDTFLMTNEDKAKSVLKEVRGPLCDDCLTEKAH